MARKPKSELQKKNIDRQKKICALDKAVAAYRDLSSREKVSICSIALKYKVNKDTLKAHLDPNHVSINEFNATKQTLSPTQEDILVRWVIEMADRNLALQPCVIREKAQLIAQATKPGAVIHPQWIDCFLVCHQDRLSCHWSRPLDKVRALSATREAINGYFDKYKSLVGENGKKIPPHHQFAFDECGVLRGYNQPVCVVGARSNTAPKANTSGERELITFVLVISGDGALVTSLVVFPAVHLHPAWVKNNPGKFSITKSANGYMTESLGEDWIKKFDEATTSVAGKGSRLLHIDGHCSHINIPLLDYAVAADIIVFGYPPHTTHLLQGLDVVLFSPFKSAFAKHAAEHLSVTGRDVDKCDFLEVLHRSMQDSFTKDNILTAWRKTGLRPVDPTVIADKDLAPSKPFSITHYAPLSHLLPSSPFFLPFRHNSSSKLFIWLPIVLDARELDPAESSGLSSDPIMPPNAANSPPTTKPSGRPTQLSHLLSFPRGHSDLPDALELVTTQLSAISLDADDKPATQPPAKPMSPQELEAVFRAGDTLCGLASTSLAGLLEQETVTSELRLPAVPQGHLPYDVVKAVQCCKGMPSKELWDATSTSLLNLVPWMEQVLAQCVLQQTYCDQLQAKLHIKEKPHDSNDERKILGLKGAVIWTDSEVVEGLHSNRLIRDGKKEAVQKQSEEKQLKVEAEEWKKLAQERQEHAHKVLLDQWTLNQVGRKPRKPKLEPIPEIYKKVLQSKTKQTRKKKGAESSEEEDLEEDPNYDEMR